MNTPICPICKRFLVGVTDTNQMTIVWNCRKCHYVITEKVTDAIEASKEKFILATGRPGAK